MPQLRDMARLARRPTQVRRALRHVAIKRIFPTDLRFPRSMGIYAHTKEILVQNALNRKHPGKFRHNQPIYTSQCDCTHRRRVDHRMQINGTLLCVETDEHALRKAHSGAPLRQAR